MSEWQPIETAPRDTNLLFWVVPLTADESYRDTNGNPITANFVPYLYQGKYGRWSSLSRAVCWMPLPSAPVLALQSKEHQHD